MLRGLLVFAILIVGAVAALWDRFYGLLLYLWFALFRPQEWLWFDVSSWRLSLVIGLLLVVPAIASGVFPNVSHPLSAGAVLFLLSSLLAQHNAVDPALGWYWLDFLARLILVCLLAVTLINSNRRFVLALTTIAASFGFHTAKAGMSSLLAGGARFAQGLGGAFSDNNGYAVGMVMILPLLVSAGQNAQSRVPRAGLLTAAALTAVAIVSTYSRGGLLGLAAGCLTLLALQKRRLPAVAVAVFAIPALWYFMTMQAGYLDRMRSIGAYEEEQDVSALSRLHFWRVAVAMAEDHPFGVGLSNYQPAYDSYDTSDGLYGHGRAVHSSHFQVLAETGFPGSVTYVGLFGYAMFACLVVRRRSRQQGLSQEDSRFYFTAANGLMASIAGFLVAGSFIALALNDLTWLTFALVAALDRLSAAAVRELGEREPGATRSVLPPVLAGAKISGVVGDRG